MGDRRLGFLYFVFCAALLCVGARLFQLQVLQMTAEDPDAVLRRPLPLEEVPARRGTILTRDGEILAEDRPTLELAVRYVELLRICELGGNSLFPEEDKLVRAEEKRKKKEAEAEEKKSPKGEMRNPAAADSLASRLDALSWATGCEAGGLLSRAGAIVARVRAVRRQVLGDREAEAGTRVLYDETVPHVLVSSVSVEAAARVAADAARFPGVVVQAAYRRAYPMGKAAAHVVGYLHRAPAPRKGELPEDPNVRPREWVGDAGVEKQLNSALRGVPGIINSSADPRTGRINRQVLFPAQPGRDVYLSLSAPAQRAAESGLSDYVGAVVVMDVRTGELLVLASSPSYDPARTPAAEDPSLRAHLSRATQDSVAPGSVFKPAVAFAAAASGFGPERTVTCEGAVTVGGKTYHCEGHHGAVNMEQAISLSCNVYFYKIAREAGVPAIHQWADALNLGRRTGVDLPYELPGRLPEQVRGWTAGRTMNLGIGQGDLSVTPLQVAVMMAVIANGGRAPLPTIRHRVEPPLDAEPETATEPPAPCDAALPSDALRAVRAGMRDCTLTGTGRGIAGLRDLNAAVKTGTAETRDRTINQAWLAGYLPWDKPRWAFAVVVHNVAGHGATIAGPIAAATLQALAAQPAEKLSPRRESAR